MTADPTVDRILTALADLAPACRDHTGHPDCCCWRGIEQAIATVRNLAT